MELTRSHRRVWAVAQGWKAYLTCVENPGFNHQCCLKEKMNTQRCILRWRCVGILTRFSQHAVHIIGLSLLYFTCYVRLCMYVCMYVSVNMEVGGQPSESLTMWVLGMEFKPSGVTADVLTHSHLAGPTSLTSDWVLLSLSQLRGLGWWLLCRFVGSALSRFCHLLLYSGSQTPAVLFGSLSCFLVLDSEAHSPPALTSS